jgi:hypothetical protein
MTVDKITCIVACRQESGIDEEIRVDFLGNERRSRYNATIGMHPLPYSG